MPFSLQVISATGGTYSLSAGTPYSLEQASGLWMAPVRRLTEQGPYQDGDTDRGYRLDPRTATLALNFTATSGSALDTHRDTLLSIFRPSTSTPLKLRLTRDDGAVRQLDCYTVGPVDLPLTKEHKPGNLHRAVVQLRAADPGWYDPTPGTVTVTGTAGLAANWYTAGGLIGTANVMEYGQTPSLNQAWTYTGTPTEYTVAVRATPASLTANVFLVDQAGTATDFVLSTWPAYPGYSLNGRPLYGVSIPTAGTFNVFVLSNQKVYVNTTATDVWSIPMATLTGTARTWRATGAGSVTYPLYAVYNVALTNAQVTALNGYMSQSVGGTISQVLTVAYNGDLPEYPVVSITGPIVDATLTNGVTGRSFGVSGTIAAGETYVFDLRQGSASVTAGGTSRITQLAADADITGWSIVPSPQATGGTNVLTVTGTGVNASTQVKVVYYHRYAGF